MRQTQQNGVLEADPSPKAEIEFVLLFSSGHIYLHISSPLPLSPNEPVSADGCELAHTQLYNKVDSLKYCP